MIPHLSRQSRDHPTEASLRFPVQNTAACSVDIESSIPPAVSQKASQVTRNDDVVMGRRTSRQQEAILGIVGCLSGLNHGKATV